MTFFVAGEPIPQGSLRRRGRWLTSDNPRLATWRRTVALVSYQVRRQRVALAGPVRLQVAFVLPRPRLVPAHRLDRPCVKPDLDKLLRAVGDALTGVLLQDDGQIVALAATKHYADELTPVGATITVTALTS